MRKYCYKYFACTACGVMLFLTGLVFFDGSNVSYGRSCPDILTYLVNETENEQSLPFGDDFVEGENLFENVEESLVGDSYLPEESIDDDTLEGTGDLLDNGFDSSYIDSNQTEDSEITKETFVNEQDCREGLDDEMSSDFVDETWGYNSEDDKAFAADMSIAVGDFENIDNDSDVQLFSDDSSDVMTEKEVDSLISQVESVSDELNEALREADKINYDDVGLDDDLREDSDVNIQTSLDEISQDETRKLENSTINDNSQEDLAVDSQTSFEEVGEISINYDVLTTEGSLYDVIEKESKILDNNDKAESEEEENNSDLGKNVEIVALPKAIEETLYEVDIRSDDSDRSGVEFKQTFEESILKDELVDTSNRSMFDNAENLLVEDSFVEESLNPDALEIEEINKEYGWETLEPNAEVVSNNSFIGFDSNVRSRKIPDNRLNQQYAEQVDDALTNEFWIVGANGYGYYFWKFENNTWRNCSSSEFFSTDDPQRTTIIWAHGYQTDMASASRDGSFLNSLVEKGVQSINQNKPYRLVVWKWESERNMARIRVDAKNKTALANCSGVSLGRFIGKFNPSDDVCLIGFSFGAQVVGAALQYLADNPNDYCRNAVKQDQNEGMARSGSLKTGRVSLVLVSAACDTSAFNQGGAYYSGATIPTKVTNVFNPYDYALHYYPFVSNVRAESLGVHSVSDDIFPNAKGNVVNIDVSGSVGRKHSFVDEIGCIPIETLTVFFF